MKRIPCWDKKSVLDKLYFREIYGCTPSMTEDYSSCIAWNTRRMNNMILAVGPGAPASTASSTMSSSSSSSENEDDEDEVYINDLKSSDGSCSSEKESIFRKNVYLSPSMRHGGCINTACWLSCPWRLSTVKEYNSHSSLNCNNKVCIIPSDETVTQVLTSGDDRVVKFWDVRDAMGTCSPVSNDATSLRLDNCDDKKSSGRKGSIPGSVIPLYTLSTGHVGNIFHVLPVPNEKGKIITCAADGYIRVSDLLSSNGNPSCTILGPNPDEMEDSMSFQRGGSMCFSFHFCNPNVGLACTERGLKKFDLRLSPTQQSHKNILSSNGVNDTKVCKACAVWNNIKKFEDFEDSYYVFAGGASADVGLYDLRMCDSKNRIIQKYSPSAFISRKKSDCVSVSGLDLSKDLRELLVSYENDQIYTFSIFPDAPSSGPSLKDLNVTWSDEDVPQIQKASYGAHLNRYTFLKIARYAGPKDEYICTGSDSGHAWIYARKTGEVASLLMADRSTCNGVVPHPDLPFFLTYGIDSTTKLWRASIPVDESTDDSPLGKHVSFINEPYLSSNVVTSWKSIKKKLTNFQEEMQDHEDILLPEHIPSREDDDVYEDSIFGASLFRSNNQFRRSSQKRGTFIRNDIFSLFFVLQQNYHAAFKGKIRNQKNSLGYEHDEPVRSSIKELQDRMAYIRLKYQARKSGFITDETCPWIMSPPERPLTHKYPAKYGHPADLVPDFPSDWMPYDIETTPSPFISYNVDTNTSNNIHQTEQVTSSNNSNYSHHRAWDILTETVLLLKESGNEALQNGCISLAASRYDKAIRYASIASLTHVSNTGNLIFLREDEHHNQWTSFLKTFVSVRLNLSMILLKPQILDERIAIEQAQLAIQELKPHSSTHVQARELLFKAYFRLGSAYFVQEDFSESVAAFEKSIDIQKSFDRKPETIVLLKLQEARKQALKKKKRNYKKFKSMFSNPPKKDDSSSFSNPQKKDDSSPFYHLRG